MGMGMGSKAAVSVLVLCALLAAQTMDAAPCNPAALSPCAGAIMFGGAVTPGCCVQLRAQQRCLCQYARDPSYRGYVNSPAAQNAATACGLPKLKC